MVCINDQPVWRAAELYGREAFARELDYFLCNGFVLSTPWVFILARQVRHDADINDMADVRIVFEPSACDAWFISFASGNLLRFWDYFPIEYPWVVWQRNNRVHRRRLAQVRKFATATHPHKVNDQK